MYGEYQEELLAALKQIDPDEWIKATTEDGNVF